MDVCTHSEAGPNVSSVLDEAESTGKVLIRRKDGRTYALVPGGPGKSPLDVPTIQADVTTEDIVAIVRKGRRRQPKTTDELWREEGWLRGAYWWNREVDRAGEAPNWYPIRDKLAEDVLAAYYGGA